MQTPWGYEVEAMPPLVSAEDFAAMTGGRYGDGPQVGAAIAAASQAVRGACGWHVSPSLECTAKLTADCGFAKLPAGYVSELGTVRQRRGDGWEVLDDVEWRHDGLMRRRGGFTPAWDGLEAGYTAGYDADAVPDLAYTVVGIIEGVLTATRGVMSESADGVSVSYSSQAQSVAAALTAQMGAQLAPYRLVSSHAA